MALAAAAAFACSDSPTGIRAVQFAASLGIDIATFVETRSGLFYKDVRQGQGETAVAGSFVNFTLQGWHPDGVEYEPLHTLTNVRLGVMELVSGLDEALLGMREGGERIAVVPPSLGATQGLLIVYRIELTSVH